MPLLREDTLGLVSSTPESLLEADTLRRFGAEDLTTLTDFCKLQVDSLTKTFSLI